MSVPLVVFLGQGTCPCFIIHCHCLDSSKGTVDISACKGLNISHTDKSLKGWSRSPKGSLALFNKAWVWGMLVRVQRNNLHGGQRVIFRGFQINYDFSSTIYFSRDLMVNFFFQMKDLLHLSNHFVSVWAWPQYILWVLILHKCSLHRTECHISHSSQS